MLKLLENVDLEDNFNKMMTRWKDIIVPDDNLQKVLSQIHTTHTFALETSLKRKPYKDILFHNKAILSQQQQTNGLYKTGEKVQNLGEASFLNDYVFAYLGIHDTFYSRNRELDIPVPAFGVFLSPSIEKKYNANATRRDLSSPESIEDKSKEFLSTELARIYAAYQIANNHDNNFRDYWGDYTKIINDKNYRENNWKWKIEFHYLAKIDCCDFEALLWPVREIKVSSEETLLDPDALSEIEEFSKENPKVKVYAYKCDFRKPESCFYYASFLITDFYFKNIDYIKTDDFSIEFKKWK